MFSTLHRRSVAIRSRAGTAVGPHGAHGEAYDPAGRGAGAFAAAEALRATAFHPRPAPAVKSNPGPPMTLGHAAAPQCG